MPIAILCPRRADVAPAEPAAWRCPSARLAALVFGAALLWSGVVEATTVRQMDLAGLSKRAERIYRGTVIEVREGSLNVGGGTLPTLTYRIRVVETLAGQAQEVVQFTSVGRLKAPPRADGVRWRPPIDVPELRLGHEYLLFTTRPSRMGLCTFVGLGQGCFTIHSRDGGEYAVNETNNAGLGLAAAGPADYRQLAGRIQGLRRK